MAQQARCWRPRFFILANARSRRSRITYDHAELWLDKLWPAMNYDDIKFNEQGLAPAIVQDARTLEVLTLAYMNEESLRRTIETGETWFWSRSRQELWHKGETSGNTQRVISVTVDCDGDALRILVLPNGPACHKGEMSCFHNLIHQDSKAIGQ